jgi:hypothetical protein
VRSDHAERIAALSTDELLVYLMSPLPGSPAHAVAMATLQVRIAEIQREGASDALKWARLAAVSTAAATVIAVVALVAALF